MDGYRSGRIGQGIKLIRRTLFKQFAGNAEVLVHHWPLRLHFPMRGTGLRVATIPTLGPLGQTAVALDASLLPDCLGCDMISDADRIDLLLTQLLI